jgi:MATE family multidrug resistance protein
VLVPDAFMFGHAAGAAGADFAALRDTAVVLLRFVAVYSLFDAMNLIFVSAIKGAGDTRFILATTAVTSPLPVAATWWGVRYAGGGLLWCWVVITVWIVLLALIYWGRFLQGHWRQMRVIEAEYLAGAGAQPSVVPPIEPPLPHPPEVF